MPTSLFISSIVIRCPPHAMSNSVKFSCLLKAGNVHEMYILKQFGHNFWKCGGVEFSVSCIISCSFHSVPLEYFAIFSFCSRWASFTLSSDFFLFRVSFPFVTPPDTPTESKPPVLLSFPFLLRHSAEVASTLWGLTWERVPPHFS